MPHAGYNVQHIGHSMPYAWYVSHTRRHMRCTRHGYGVQHTRHDVQHTGHHVGYIPYPVCGILCISCTVQGMVCSTQGAVRDIVQDYLSSFLAAYYVT